MRPTRVLQVVSSLKRGAGDVGTIMNYYRHMDRSRIQFDFLYFRDAKSTYEDEVRELGGRCFKIEEPSIRNIVTYRKYLARFFEASGIDHDVVHFHELLLVSLAAPILRKRGSIHLIAHSHSNRYSFSTLKAVRNFLLCIPMRKLVDHYCSCSESSAKFWFGAHNMERVTVIKNAIDCKKYAFDANVRSRVRSQLGLGESFVIGHVGRFSKEKNHEFLLRMFAEVLKYEPETVLLLAGDGPTMPKIKNQADALRIRDRVIFLGQRSDVHELYQAMDVFVLPSLAEGIPLALIEAQASGLPCIVSDTLSREVGVCNIEFLSLRANLSDWVECGLRARNVLRNDTTEIMKRRGFCIKSEAERLQKYYERLLVGYGKDD